LILQEAQGLQDWHHGIFIVASLTGQTSKRKKKEKGKSTTDTSYFGLFLNIAFRRPSHIFVSSLPVCQIHQAIVFKIKGILSRMENL
jgi:hypothetical protein